MTEQREKAIIITVNLNNQPHYGESVEELRNLAIACNLEVVGHIEQNLKAIHAAHYIGSGKVEEVAALAKEVEAEVLVFDEELSPTQMRNLDKMLHRKILDRTSLILEIFAQRARTREAMLQVEVARLQYMLPRLVGSHDYLGRQSGGVGTKNKGTGEKKLELDRRKIAKGIESLSKELELLTSERETQRKRRTDTGLPRVALVGYTNAGKSTLMNAMVELTNKGDYKKVFEKDMLFATLETSVRNITLPDRKSFLLSDTVGFVNKLPHNLVKAFRSTLEEVRDADLLLHMIDVSNPNYHHQMEVTNETLREIGADGIPTILVFNKVDLAGIEPPAPTEHQVYISAKEKTGMEDLIKIIGQYVFTEYVECKLLIPYDQTKVVSYFNENAHVKDLSYETEGALLTLECRESDYKRYAQFAYV